MKVVIAMDSFKGSLSSMAAGRAAREGVLRACPNAEVIVRPLADGGEGTVDALVEGLNGQMVSVQVTGPLGAPVESRYGILADGVAVMEMASACGLTLVPLERRDPRLTTTYGLGEMILDALERGCRSFIIGIGGSATNDGGIGMLSALGVRFLTAAGACAGMDGKAAARVEKIDVSRADPRLAQCSFRIACDVENPLCGPSGTSHVYGMQKVLRQRLQRSWTRDWRILRRWCAKRLERIWRIKRALEQQAASATGSQASCRQNSCQARRWCWMQSTLKRTLPGRTLP